MEATNADLLLQLNQASHRNVGRDSSKAAAKKAIKHD